MLPTDFWADVLPFSRNGTHRDPPSGPTIRRGGDPVWQRSDLWVGGSGYRHGLSVNTPSAVTIDLNRTCTAFQAKAGLDDFGIRVGTVRFRVEGGDGQVLWSSGRVGPGDRAVPVRADLTGQRSIRLVVTPDEGGWGLINLADWADARVTCV
ncbi:hypothetical protein GCM10009664_74980 [Kitasatospora gansuensis]